MDAGYSAEDALGAAKSSVKRSRAKRQAARKAQRKKEDPRVAVSQSGENVQGTKPGSLRGQIKTGMDGETKVGVQDDSADRNNGAAHKPAVDVGKVKAEIE